KRTSPRHISIKSQGKRAFFTEVEDLEDGWIRFRFSHTYRWTRRLTPEIVSRAIHKIALGLFALDFGVTAACDSKFDAARNFISGQALAAPNQLVIRTRMQPVAQGGGRYYDELPGTMILVDIFGLWFLANLEEQPRLELNDEVRAAGFKEFP